MLNIVISSNYDGTVIAKMESRPTLAINHLQPGERGTRGRGALHKLRTKRDDMSNRTVMIVDDEERLVRNTTKIFERLGSTVHRAFSGEEALDILGQHDVDVVFLDVNMPGMNGIETLAEIKQRHPLVQVIMITGAFNRDQAAEGLRLGANDFLLKPVNISEFVAKADEAFNKRKEMEKKLQMMSD